MGSSGTFCLARGLTAKFTFKHVSHMTGHSGQSTGAYMCHVVDSRDEAIKQYECRVSWSHVATALQAAGRP